MRITEKDLKAVIARLNKLTNNPPAPYIGNVGQVGSYLLDCAYGGYSLHQIANESGGARDVLGCGHTTRKELYYLMHAFIRGIEAGTPNG